MAGRPKSRTPKKGKGSGSTFDPSIFADDNTGEPANTGEGNYPKKLDSSPRFDPPSIGFDAIDDAGRPADVVLVPTDTYQPLAVPMRVIEGMASIGCSDADIYRCVGLTERGWQKLLAAKPEIRERIENARAAGARSVVKALYDQALSGNQHAIVFWLVNRRKGDWSGVNSIKVEHSGKIDTGASELLKDVADDDLASKVEQIAERLRRKKQEPADKPEPDLLQ